MAARRCPVFPNDGDVPTAPAHPVLAIACARPRRSPHAKPPCRDLPALNPHSLKRNLANNHPTPLRFGALCLQEPVEEPLAPVCFVSLQPAPAFTPTPTRRLLRSSIHTRIDRSTSFQPSMENESRILRCKNWDRSCRWIGLCRVAPGNSTPKLKQPSGPRQIVCGYGVVNHEPEADQVFVKAKRRNRSIQRSMPIISPLRSLQSQPGATRISQDHIDLCIYT